MKRKILAILLPVIGVAAVAGSGFSAWVFNTSTASANSSVTGSISVTDVVSQFGTVVVTNGTKTLATSGDGSGLTEGAVKNTISSFAVVLDQGGEANAANRTKGISIVDNTTDNNLISNIHATFEFNDKDNIAVYSEAGYSLKATVTATWRGALATYVEFTDGNVLGVGSAAANGKFNSNSWSHTFALDSATGGDAVSNNEFIVTLDTSTSDNVNNLLQYTEHTVTKPTDQITDLTGKPENAEEYTFMVDELSTNSGIDFDFKFELTKPSNN